MVFVVDFLLVIESLLEQDTIPLLFEFPILVVVKNVDRTVVLSFELVVDPESAHLLNLLRGVALLDLVHLHLGDFVITQCRMDID